MKASAVGFLLGLGLGIVSTCAISHRYTFTNGLQGSILYRCNQWTGEVTEHRAGEGRWRPISEAPDFSSFGNLYTNAVTQ